MYALNHRLFNLVVIAGLSLSIGCAHKSEPKSAAQTSIQQVSPTLAEQRAVRAQLHPIYFENESAELTAESQALLNAEIDVINSWPSTRILITGHPDESGGETHNLNLGALRASNVRQYLVDHGVDLSRIWITSQGESQATVDAESPEEIRGDRRVDFGVIWPTPPSLLTDQSTP